MFARRFDVCTVLGIHLRMDLGCVAISMLLTWMLATGLFPTRHLGLSDATYWAMGVAGSVGLFGSVLLHELGHSMVAQRLGIPIDGITLFTFGGVAEMFEEPSTPGAELMMAAAGPLMSSILAAFFIGLAGIHGDLPFPRPVLGIVEYLGAMNAVLVAFNVLPAFPLDGGRMLRATLWWWRDSQEHATRTAALLGNLFAWGFGAIGVWQMISSDIPGGIWWVMIAVFIRATSASAYRQFLSTRTVIHAGE